MVCRAPSTVANNLRLVKKLIKENKGVGVEDMFMSYGPMPCFDHCSYQVAIGMILSSTRSGRYDRSYTQFETIRHLRSAHSSFKMISAQNALNHLSLTTSGGFQRDIASTSTSSVWFKRFFAGCRSRMGQIYKPNLALTTTLILALLNKVISDVHNLKSQEGKFDRIIFGRHVVISYVLSLRSSEGLMLNLTALIKEDRNKRSYCLVPLKGKFKGESIECDHVLPCCTSTSSGINIRQWLRLLILAHGMAGRSGGPGITDWTGSMLTSSALD